MAAFDKTLHQPGLMHPSTDFYNLCREFEGKRTVAYDDGCGNWTIGYGHTRGVHPGMTIDEGTVERFLSEDAEDAARSVRELITAPLTQGMFDALTDFVFNLGRRNFARSTLRKLINSQQYKAAAGEFEKWDMAGHYHLEGLERRREAERRLFTK